MRTSSRHATPPSLPFASTVLRLTELEGPADEPSSPLTDQDLARLRCLLEPGGDVDRVARRERASLARAADDDLAGVHPDPERELLAEQLGHPLLHPERDLQRPLSMVLLRRGRSEHCDNRVADELLERPPAERDLRFHRIVEAVEQVARVLGIERAAQLRRANQVGEEDRRQLSLASR